MLTVTCASKSQAQEHIRVAASKWLHDCPFDLITAQGKCAVWASSALDLDITFTPRGFGRIQADLRSVEAVQNIRELAFLKLTPRHAAPCFCLSSLLNESRLGVALREELRTCAVSGRVRSCLH